jgi:hypothetical protein
VSSSSGMLMLKGRIASDPLLSFVAVVGSVLTSLWSAKRLESRTLVDAGTFCSHRTRSTGRKTGPRRNSKHIGNRRNQTALFRS